VSADLPEAARDLRRKVHQTIQRVTQDLERIHLNTAVSAFHELYNEITRVEAEVAEGAGRAVLREALETLVLLMSPYTPHVCEEMWVRLGRRPTVVDRPWPVADPALAREDEVELAVQVNGKVRGRITVPREAPEEEVKRLALEEPRVKEHVAGKEVVRQVVVPGRLVSVVVR
jgi:leucyl-tRNA synthetase